MVGKTGYALIKPFLHYHATSTLLDSVLQCLHVRKDVNPVGFHESEIRDASYRVANNFGTGAFTVKRFGNTGHPWHVI